MPHASHPIALSHQIASGLELLSLPYSSNSCTRTFRRSPFCSVRMRMEGSGDGLDGSKEGVLQGNGRVRSASLKTNQYFRRLPNTVQVLPDPQISLAVNLEDGMDGGVDSQGNLLEQTGEEMEVKEVGARWRRFPHAGDVLPGHGILSDNRLPPQVHEAAGEGQEQRHSIRMGDEVEMTDPSGWRNPRAHRERRHARARLGSRNDQALSGPSSITQPRERNTLGRFSELFDRQSKGPEASSSGVREAENSPVIVGVSSDEESREELGKGPIHDVIDLASDLPQYDRAGIEDSSMAQNDGIVYGGVGSSQNSGNSPLRRLMQRPTLGSSKRARRILHRGGRGHPEAATDQGGESLGLDDAGEGTSTSGEQRSPRLNVLVEPYNLRRNRGVNMVLSALRNQMDNSLNSMGSSSLSNRIDSSLNSMESSTLSNRMASSLNSMENSSHYRYGRHRLNRSGPGAGSRLSELSSLQSPSSMTPSDTSNVSRDIELGQAVDLDESESPTVISVRPGNPIVLDDDVDTERALQLAEDERVARELQDSFTIEGFGSAQPPTDEMLARMLQEEENSQSRGMMSGRRPLFFGPAGPFQAFLADAEDQRETRRLLRYGMGQAESSSGGVRRSGQGRSSAFSRMLNPQIESASNNVDEERVRFPPTMGLESRLEFLAALEMAFQEQLPIGLQLAHVDRDFNENDYEMLLALDTDNDRHRGASRESIRQLPVMTILPTDVCEEDCSICLEVPVSGDVVRRLPCMHVFHQECIDKWLQCQAVCPICKAHI